MCFCLSFFVTTSFFVRFSFSACKYNCKLITDLASLFNTVMYTVPQPTIPCTIPLPCNNLTTFQCFDLFHLAILCFVHFHVEKVRNFDIDVSEELFITCTHGACVPVCTWTIFVLKRLKLIDINIIQCIDIQSCVHVCFVFRRRQDFVNYARKLVEGSLEVEDIETEVQYYLVYLS